MTISDILVLYYDNGQDKIRQKVGDLTNQIIETFLAENNDEPLIKKLYENLYTGL